MLRNSEKLDNFCIFRLISLWTQNSFNANVNKTVQEKLTHISTHKFLVLMHQIAARISLKCMQNSSSSSSDADAGVLKGEQLFQSILIDLITRITSDHPHHSLPVLLAFQNANKDFLLSSAAAPAKQSKADEVDMNTYLMTEDRVNTATFILNKLRSESTQLRAIVDSMSTLCEAYIELANMPVSPKTKSSETLSFAKSLLINKVKNFSHISVLTRSLPVHEHASKQQQPLISIVRFDNKFKVANGINMPKIVHCYGSDGVGYKQLVKGRDDMRQDAVMQQFFATVNDLIQFSNSGQKTMIRLNKVRTYKIVPLSKKSGVLEWCQNTITLGKMYKN